MERWTDERLDDLAAEMRRRLDRIERRTEPMTDLPAKLEELAADTTECRSGVAELRAAIARRAEERARERIAALEKAERDVAAKRAEKKEDRRYQVKLLLTCTSLILGGVTILVTVLT